MVFEDNQGNMFIALNPKAKELLEKGEKEAKKREKEAKRQLEDDRKRSGTGTVR